MSVHGTRRRMHFSLWNNPLFEDPTNRSISNNLLFEGVVRASSIQDSDDQSQWRPATNKESTASPFDSLTHTDSDHAIRETTLYCKDIHLPLKNGVQGAKKKNATASVLINHESRRFKIPPGPSHQSVRLVVMSLWSPRALCKTTTVYFNVSEKNFFLNSVLEFDCCMNIYVETSYPQEWCLGHNKDCCCHLIFHKRTVELVLLKAVGLSSQNDPRTKATICVEMDALCFKPECTVTRIKVDYLSTFEAAELLEIINTEIIEHCHVPFSTGFTSQTRTDDNIILISESNTNDPRLKDKAIVNLKEARLTDEDKISNVSGASKLDKVTTQGYDVGSNRIRTKAHAVGKEKQEPFPEESEEDDNEHELFWNYQFTSGNSLQVEL